MARRVTSFTKYAAMLALASLCAWPIARAETVPVVGCRSDGQSGPLDPPTQPYVGPDVPMPAAAGLAYYVSASLGVLAPRGWQCLGEYGSGGSELIVTPDNPGSAIEAVVRAAAGPSVFLQFVLADNPGRFVIARIAARLFPSAHDFVERIIAEGIEPRRNFSTSLLPGETLRRLSRTMVEFRLPGLKWPKDGKDVTVFVPTKGVAILLPNEGMNLVQATVKLPSKLDALSPVIIRWVEQKRGAVRSIP